MSGSPSSHDLPLGLRHSPYIMHYSMHITRTYATLNPELCITLCTIYIPILLCHPVSHLSPVVALYKSHFPYVLYNWLRSSDRSALYWIIPLLWSTPVSACSSCISVVYCEYIQPHPHRGSTQGKTSQPINEVMPPLCLSSACRMAAMLLSRFTVRVQH